MIGLVVSECCGLWEPLEQCHDSGYVLVCSNKVQEAIIIFDDSPVHVVGPGMCAPTIHAMSDFMLELHALLLQLEPCILKLLLSCPQLIHPRVRRDPYIILPLALVNRVS
jgi:hypothetical protein